MGVINHFYDSDAEDDEDQENKSTKMDALSKELEEQKIKKLQEMRGKKQEFTAGMWNAQTIFMGGLGKDPDVEGLKTHANIHLLRILTSYITRSRCDP